MNLPNYRECLGQKLSPTVDRPFNDDNEESKSSNEKPEGSTHIFKT